MVAVVGTEVGYTHPHASVVEQACDGSRITALYACAGHDCGRIDALVARVVVVLLVVLIALTGVTAYFAFNAYTTVQAYGAKFASFEKDLTGIKTEATRLRADSDAVAGRLKRVEDEVARVRR
jgi:hypothetical protein